MKGVPVNSDFVPTVMFTHRKGIKGTHRKGTERFCRPPAGVFAATGFGPRV